jgi:integrase
LGWVGRCHRVGLLFLEVVGMGHVEDRWWRVLPDGTRQARERAGVGLRWRARYRDAEGGHRAKSFARKKDADRFLALVTADLLRGSYVDPGLSRRSLREYATVWLAAQPVRETTRRCYDSHLRNWILPALGHRSLQSLTPTDVRGLMRVVRERLAPMTAWHIHSLLATVLRSAVEDGWLRQSPCRRTAPPRPRRATPAPTSTQQVRALIGSLPERYRVAVWLGAGCGLRVGEVLGLTLDDIDLDAQIIRVRCQLQAEPGGRLRLAAPKSEASIRTVPLPDTVAEAIREHLTRFSISEQSMLAPERFEQRLLIRGPRGGAGWPRTFHGRIWRTATTTAGLFGVRFHALRHYYATALIVRRVASDASWGSIRQVA